MNSWPRGLCCPHPEAQHMDAAPFEGIGCHDCFNTWTRGWLHPYSGLAVVALCRIPTDERPNAIPDLPKLSDEESAALNTIKRAALSKFERQRGGQIGE